MRLNIRNISTSEKRVAIRPIDGSIDIADATNPTVQNVINEGLTFCLAVLPPPPPAISCDGATDTSNCMSFDGTFNLFIEGQNSLTEATGEDIYNFFSNHPDFEVIDCDDDNEIVCTPSNMTLRVGWNHDLTYNVSETKADKITYRLDGGALQEFTASENAITVSDMLNEFSLHLGKSGFGSNYLFDHDNTTTHFDVYSFNGEAELAIEGYTSDEEGVTPVSITFVLMDHTDDFTSTYATYGEFESEIVLTSCGKRVIPRQ